MALCAGFGGIELGLRLALGSSYHTVAYCEREAYPAATLVARIRDGFLHDAPIWDDITSFDGKPWSRKVHLIAAGAPCQPWSSAARGRNNAVDLLPHVIRVAFECSAPLVFIENVRHSRRALGVAACVLRSLGYGVTSLTEVAAAALGATHNRPRLWLLAYAHSHSELVMRVHGEMGGICPTDGYLPWRTRPSDSILGIPDGIPNRVERNRGIGNAVVPVVAAWAFRALVGQAACMIEAGCA